MTERIRVACLVVVLCCAGCGDTPKKASEGGGEKPVVFAVNYPLAYFAERIGGDAIEVKFPVPADEDPAFWKPSDEEVAAFQKADLILRNGATYAKWMAVVSLPTGTQVDTSMAFAGDLIVAKAEATHSHGGDGEHAHGGTAFTTWIDLKQAIAQAEAVRDAVTRLAPASKAGANFELLKAELEELDAGLEKVASRIGDRAVVGSHTVYPYFARRYGLNLKSVHWEPETVPDEKAMGELKKLLVGHPAQWMIWEGDPAEASVAKLEGLGIKSLVVDPCGNRPEVGDFLRVMKANLSALEKAFPE